MVDKDYDITLKSYANVFRNMGIDNVYDGDSDDLLCDCVIITDDNDRYRLNSRFVEHRCPYLIPFMLFNETTQQYTIHTSVSIDIIKEIFYALKYENINVKDWLQLEQILKVANDWELDSIKRCVVQNFVDGINEENCISVWRMCAKYLPEQIKKTFEYVLYIVNSSVNNGYNLDYFRLKCNHLFEILNADLLKVNDEMDVWILLKLWILIDRKKRMPYCRSLLKCIRYNLLNDEQKNEIIKDLTHFKINIIDGQKSINWSMNTETRIPRDLLLAIGGWEKRGPTNVAEVLNINTNKWQRAKILEDKRQIAYHECIVINNKLYVIGGFEGTQYFNSTRCYDSETKEWSELAPMNYARCYISACEINGTIIAAGGSDGRSRLRTAEMYDISKNQWTKIRNMTQRRSDAAACAMGGKMYVAGGYTGETVLQTVEMYTPETDIWTEVAHMSSPRSGLACAASTDFILIAGGYDGTNRLSSAEILRNGSAHTVNVESMPMPRSNFAMCKMGNYFYAIGGYNRTVTKTVVRFDGKKWERICDLSVSRSALRVVLLKAWPDPNELLCNTNTNSEITQNWTYEIESSECQETSGSQITDISDNSN
ncbi:unnamed protein product [Brugia pahangi]|uniref:BACK domain-containing protein n=1 Tax=Brugia pahangi TaxID=6280 RepID=A0A0N4T3B9_BRUPA|nr:unnamed protein product [Brugia pahangi]